MISFDGVAVRTLEKSCRFNRSTVNSHSLYATEKQPRDTKFMKHAASLLEKPSNFKEVVIAK